MDKAEIRSPTLLSFHEVVDWPKEKIRKSFGGKALGLYEAFQLGLSIPPTWLLSIDFYERFIQEYSSQDHKEFKKKAISWLQNRLKESSFETIEGELFAVRSSSQFEDAFEQSFAGIFETILDVPRNQLAIAIASVWDSCFALKATSYASTQIDLRMGVLIQPMIQSKYSGVAFSKHPSPANVYENNALVIEFAPALGEKIVQGELTPFRLTGDIEHLLATVDAPWLASLLDTILTLKNAFSHEIDVEFVVDETEKFWLVQQRPISRLHPSHVLDLTFYERKYKRPLFGLDIEFLIEGCSQFLAPYLEIPYSLDRWMVMTTGKDGIQELWVHSLLDRAIIQKIASKIEEENYLDRLLERYHYYYNILLYSDYGQFFNSSIPLEKRFFKFTEFILPLEAHYYVPIFVIEALHQLLRTHFIAIDATRAEADLFLMGTFEISSLFDILYEKLRPLKPACVLASTYEALSTDIQQQLETISSRYGFLKCRQIDEKGFTPQELFAQVLELPKQPISDDTEFRALKEKYLKNVHTKVLFERFREWMRIRNQEMEFLMYAIIRVRPLFEEIASHLNLSILDIWKAPKELIYKAIRNNTPWLIQQFATDRLAIFRAYGKTRLHNGVTVTFHQKDQDRVLRGKTVFGTGSIEAVVKIVFNANELEGFETTEPTVLVTGMTTPDFIPYLRKQFSALITDEGGILCHAAIVARESSIPCIVGTGKATELLKEKTLVHIDFDRGEVLMF